MMISTSVSTLVSLLLVMGQASGKPAPSSTPAPKDGALYANDFSATAVESFPTDLTFKGGNMWVVDHEGRPMLQFQGGSWFHIPLDTTLPENFTIEFDYHTTESYAVLFVAPFDAATSGDRPPSYSGFREGEFHFFSIANTSVGAAVDAAADNLPRSNGPNKAFTEGVVPIRLDVKGNQARILIDGKQAAMLPAARFLRTDVLEFFYGSMGAPGNGYVGNIRVVAN